MTDSASCWRLIDTGLCSGMENMATDEALLHHFNPVLSRPVLRLYGWNPPAISIGRFQKVADIDIMRTSDDRLSIVRRITGGGAIFHADELTYSIICSSNDIPNASSVKKSFKSLTSFLLNFYRTLGLNASYAVDEQLPEGSRLGERTALCYAGRESYDLLVNGCKIGGNAQRRLKNIIFQHGSIPISGHLSEALLYIGKGSQHPCSSATSLEEEGVSISVEKLKKILVSCFEIQMGIRLEPDSLNHQEQTDACRLAHEKYADEYWTMEGIAS